jgi:hypothetical protein
MFAARGRRFRFRFRFRFRSPRGSEFSPPFSSNEQTSRDGLGQCEREIAGRSDSLLWLDGEGDPPGKIRTAFLPQRASRTKAGARRETNRLTTRSGFTGQLYCEESAEDRKCLE